METGGWIGIITGVGGLAALVTKFLLDRQRQASQAKLSEHEQAFDRALVLLDRADKDRASLIDSFQKEKASLLHEIDKLRNELHDKP